MARALANNHLGDRARLNLDAQQIYACASRTALNCALGILGGWRMDDKSCHVWRRWRYCAGGSQGNADDTGCDNQRENTVCGHGSNESKMSDACRERAPIAVKVC